VTLFNMRNCISEFPKAFYESGIWISIYSHYKEHMY
jgi:hypothetical protein